MFKMRQSLGEAKGPSLANASSRPGCEQPRPPARQLAQSTAGQASSGTLRFITLPGIDGTAIAAFVQVGGEAAILTNGCAQQRWETCGRQGERGLETRAQQGWRGSPA